MSDAAPPDSEPPAGFFSRWSRLKRGEALPEVAPAAAPDAVPAVVPVAPVPEQAAEEPAFDLSLLPKLEELSPESDIRGFLHKAVPAGLRNAALKRMWALDPAIRDFVGPVDYAWDFNDPAGLPGISEALTGDVTEMLARAIGAAPQQETEDVEVEQPELAPQPEVSTAALSLPEQSLPAAAFVDPGVETVSVRRRHGGARPILTETSG
jgi:hypothetical protein